MGEGIEDNYSRNVLRTHLSNYIELLLQLSRPPSKALIPTRWRTRA
jgi:hypothetical protein